MNQDVTMRLIVYLACQSRIKQALSTIFGI